jgi:hypothetical protein
MRPMKNVTADIPNNKTHKRHSSTVREGRGHAVGGGLTVWVGIRSGVRQREAVGGLTKSQHNEVGVWGFTLMQEIVMVVTRAECVCLSRSASLYPTQLNGIAAPHGQWRTHLTHLISSN